ncbi:hypothetical protein BDP27DRAFT_1260731 [Rhodocollybia butyracea]|uniref:Uncharacterized protein n=1 Tax=Rhodocollybia butyracea TaxID=206335 RepID=A0A9P5UCF1_9AGAR|nr:hypothetical protein BDP27DRAFT_1260731 [Rhodocollybia butyracea]
MPSLSEARTFNSSYNPTYIPVAVFLGGTGGIAASTAEHLSRYTNGKLHVIIAGRNRVDGARVLESLVKPLEHQTPTSELLREFVFCDASSLASVHTAGETISELLAERLPHSKPRINFLVLSAPHFNLISSYETVDGLDRQLMMRYYHRFKMAYELMPLLRVARDEGQDAKVLSILASGFSFPFDPNNFGFKNLGVIGQYTKAFRTVFASATYMDIIIEEFASREQGISFTNLYPGVVRTAQLDWAFQKHWLFTPFRPFFDFFMKLTSMSVEDSGEWVLFSLLDAKAEGKGFYRRGEHGEEYNPGEFDSHARKVVREQLFDHSILETRAEELVDSSS